MSNLLSASNTLLRLVQPHVGRLQSHQPGLARRLQRAAERAEDEVTEAACELGRVRRKHLRGAHTALLEVRGCLEAARGGSPVLELGGTEEALALTRRLLDHVGARARSA